MTTRTRSNATYCGVLDFKTTRKLELSAKASAYQKRDHYLKVFRDPPNAEELMRRTATPSASDAYDAASREVSSSGPFRSLQFNGSCTNCENIFKAVLFLHNRIPEKAHLQDETYQFGFTKDSASFKELAVELGSIEPSLRNVTTLALVSLYEKIIKERKALSDFLVVATGFTWADTQMSDMALSLVENDRVLRDRENRQQATKSEAKKQQVSEAVAVKRQVIDAMLGTLTGKKRASQVVDEAGENAGVRIINDSDDDADDDADPRPPPVVPSESTPTPIYRSRTRVPANRRSCSRIFSVKESPFS
ncbi:hypothetical protein EC957_000088 [Mortierella hygrophila]|uniref:Uncharacterized protein n=1 Tax=Mortierella hygrophila TaxID=979708 RepID=A0A9P6K933_9FUNG|nr:hypothetical protein EC957_000043 [Mortierella hygrophila]KAF9552015.1 hypothetical protein EC957_000088 [Mortierella hygrophila]